ncbi:MAG: glycosyltransferase family 4 protein [Pirellulales bacterium]|nr:glycosyltransferase family 4 protein [Pirellulales bacterium]
MATSPSREQSTIRVLFVVDHEGIHGGDVQAVEMIVRYGTERGIKVAAITPHAEDQSAIALKNAGAEVFSFGRPFLYSTSKPFRSLDAIFNFSRSLKKVIDACNPHIIETNHATAETFTSFGQLLIGNSVPRIFCQRCNLNAYHGVSGTTLRLALRSVKAVVSVSPYSVREYSRLLRVPPNRLLHIPDCVESHRFSHASTNECESNALREKWCGGSADILVGILGHISPNKNTALLVEAARILSKRFNNVRFIIMGRCGISAAEYHQRLLDTVSECGLGDRVIFTGFIDKYTAIPALDIVVSLSQNEGFGMSVIEAGACGKPVIATRSGGPDYIIQDGINGFLIPRNDIDMLVRHLASLFTDHDLRVRMGEKGKEIVENHYNPVANIERRIELYRDLLKKY